MTALALVALIVVHEAGHALCARLHGLRVGVFAASPWRFGITAAPETREQDRSIACAGPLASILAGLGLVAAGMPLAGWAGIILFGIAQLSPRKGFDGQRIYGRRTPC